MVLVVYLPANDESPGPNGTGVDVAYNNTNSPNGLVIVDGLGGGSCSYPLSTIE
jgi:hypothetical protein